MNASGKSTLLAEGIYVFAKVQNQPWVDDGSEQWFVNSRDWTVWKQKHPELVSAVEKLQSNLFDRCLNDDLPFEKGGLGAS